MFADVLYEISTRANINTITIGTMIPSSFALMDTIPFCFCLFMRLLPLVTVYSTANNILLIFSYLYISLSTHHFLFLFSFFIYSSSFFMSRFMLYTRIIFQNLSSFLEKRKSCAIISKVSAYVYDCTREENLRWKT